MTHVRPVNRQTFSYTPITQASYIAQKALAITFCKYLSAGVRILKTTPVPFSGTCPILFLSEVMFSSPWARLCSTDLVDWPFALQNFAMAMWGCSFGCTVHIFIFPCCCLVEHRDYWGKWYYQNRSLQDKGESRDFTARGRLHTSYSSHHASSPAPLYPVKEALLGRWMRADNVEDCRIVCVGTAWLGAN